MKKVNIILSILYYIFLPVNVCNRDIYNFQYIKMSKRMAQFLTKLTRLSFFTEIHIHNLNKIFLTSKYKKRKINLQFGLEHTSIPITAG